MKVLYITYDGLTDPLGRSQVLPYILALHQKGIEYVILSCDKPERYFSEKAAVETLLKPTSIQWVPEEYEHRYPIISAMRNQRKLLKKAVELAQIHQFDIIHCRSYIPTEIGLRLKQKFGSKVLFDMRGFFPDERVDGGVWNLKNPIYRRIYNYFKKKEFQYFTKSDYTISLTEAGKREILSREGLSALKIQVITCCADMDFFNSTQISESRRNEARKSLNISENASVFTYLGSLGTWYLPEQMLDFAKVYMHQKTDAVFLFITPDKPEEIYKLAITKGLNIENIRIKKANREEVPLLLSLGSFSIFFIKPSFSKKASSPTKMGEILSMGQPCVCNSSVGDVAEIVKETDCGVLIETFDEAAYQKAVSKLEKLHFPPEHYRNAAQKYYALERGVELYYRVFHLILYPK